jgi:hypothetical protein
MKRGACAFGTGRQGSFDGGRPDRFTAGDAGRYISKYLRPDGAKTSFVPLLYAVGLITPRDPSTGRHKYLLRPVYVSTKLTKKTGVKMGFLRFRRWVFVAWGAGVSDGELRFAYELRWQFGAEVLRRESVVAQAEGSGRGIRFPNRSSVLPACVLDGFSAVETPAVVRPSASLREEAGASAKPFGRSVGSRGGDRRRWRPADALGAFGRSFAR